MTKVAYPLLQAMAKVYCSAVLNEKYILLFTVSYNKCFLLCFKPRQLLSAASNVKSVLLSSASDDRRFLLYASNYQEKFLLLAVSNDKRFLISAIYGDKSVLLTAANSERETNSSV